MEGAKNLILPVLFLGAESEKKGEGGKGKLCLGGKTNKRERREEFGIGLQKEEQAARKLMLRNSKQKWLCSITHYVQGDNSGRLQPPVDLVPTVLAANGPLLQLHTAWAG